VWHTKETLIISQQFLLDETLLLIIQIIKVLVKFEHPALAFDITQTTHAAINRAKLLRVMREQPNFRERFVRLPADTKLASCFLAESLLTFFFGLWGAVFGWLCRDRILWLV
jgi:hypothetical protein